MTETPDTLREWAKNHTHLFEDEEQFLVAHADAWELDLARQKSFEEHHEATDAYALRLEKQLAASEQARQRAETALMRYGRHERDCRTRWVGMQNAMRDDCSCGLWLAIGLPEDWRPYVPAALAPEP